MVKKGMASSKKYAEISKANGKQELKKEEEKCVTVICYVESISFHSWTLFSSMNIVDNLRTNIST